MFVTKMSYYQNVLLPTCPVTEMSNYRNVLLQKCPVIEMSVTKTSIKKVSFTDMFGYQHYDDGEWRTNNWLPDS